MFNCLRGGMQDTDVHKRREEMYPKITHPTPPAENFSHKKIITLNKKTREISFENVLSTLFFDSRKENIILIHLFEKKRHLK